MRRNVPSSHLGLYAGSMGLLLFLSIPIVALVAYARPASLLEHVRSPMALQALWLTLRTTAVATFLCLVLGLPVAYLLARVHFRGRGIVETITELPVTIPPVVAGVALLLAFGRMGLVGRHLSAWGIEIGFTTVAVVMAQVFIASPFFVKAAAIGFQSVDRDLEDVALTMGASRWRAFWTVTVPQAAPALVGGAVLAWARALSEFGATMMFAGNFPGRTQTLTLAVMSAMDTDVDTAIAISIISVGLAVCTLALAKVFIRQWVEPHP